MKLLVSISMFFGSVLFCFVFGTMIGSSFASFCLPNGCGYEAGGAIGFFSGIFLGIFVSIYAWKKW